MIDTAAFKRMAWRDQNATLTPHLHWVLARLVQPVPTHHVAYALSERTGLDEKELAQLLLRRYAKRGYASQDGEVAHAYGKTFTRWRWHPRPEAVV